jgi:hypothetical protein
MVSEAAPRSGPAAGVEEQSDARVRSHVVLLAGTLLILAEILSSQVLLSQIGNFLVWGGSAAFAWLLVRGEAGAPAGARAGQALPAGQQYSSRRS